MAHGLTQRENGFVEMAFTGNRSGIWHGLGNEMVQGASIEDWTKAAGMDWIIKREPVCITLPDNAGQISMPEKHMLYREKDGKNIPLSIVSDSYKLVQPAEVLEFFRDLLPAGFQMNTAGTIFDGRRFWALADIGETASIVGHDEIGGYLLLSTSCDGSLATTADFTTIRVVCNNTLSMATSSRSKQAVTVSHRTKFCADSMKDKLGIARGHFHEFINASKSLAAKACNDKAAEKFFQSLMFKDDVSLEDQSTQAKNKVAAMLALFAGEGKGADLEGAKGTMWGAVNAVTEWVDHHQKRSTFDAKLDNIMFGQGADLKTKAFELALAA